MHGGIANGASGTVNMNGGTINIDASGNKIYGIVNRSVGAINMKGGTINASSGYGIYNTSLGIVNIGIKNGGIVSNIEPNIKGGEGIYNKEGEVYFYDGLIQGSTRFGEGGITSIEDGYQIKEDTIEGYNSIYLEEQEEIYIVRNETTNKDYTTLQEAVEEATNNEENSLKILRDFDLKTSIEIPENKIINIDLAGNIITNNYIKINNYGDLTIEDSVGNGKIMCEEVTGGIYNMHIGTVTLKGGTIESSSSLSGDVYGIYNYSTGTINVNGGTVSASSASSSSSKVSYGIYNYSTGTINVNGGTVSATSTSSTSYGIYNNSTGTINVNGGTVSSTSTSERSYGIYNNSTGTININEGIISAIGSSYGCGIYNMNGKINVNGGTIYSSYIGIVNSSRGIVSINGGNISATSTSSSSYGLYNSSNGILNIGTKGDGIVSNTEPSINAESTSSVGTGIYNKTGTLYFYDGRIEGSSLAVSQDSVITEREDNTELLYEDDDKVLTLTTEAMDIAKIGNTTYSSLQDAINAAGTNTTTIELLRGIQYTNQDTTLTIANNQDITLDLKGFPIISAIEDAVITNNGKLKITDSTQEAKGKISGSYENIIHNKPGATLELNNGTITRIISKDNIVYNEGTVNVTGGTISQPGYGYSGYVIYNIANATLNISAGTISGGADSIYNKGNVNITSGTIGRGITNTDSGSLRIENGTINGTIQNSGNASVEITGGNITTTGNYGIHNTSTNSVTVSGGTISSNTHGIYSTTGTVTIGTKDGNIVGTPAITGNTCGITAQGGVLNIYDGTINGKTSAISGEITELEEQSEIVVNRAEEYETITLVEKDTPLAQVGANEYYSLQDAIDSISGTGTVTILREGTVENTINNVAGKNVTLDLNGNILKMYTKIQNTGTLNITDTSGEITGNLISYKDSPIYNSGNLEFISGKISENSYGIYNQTNGTAVISGGNLNNNTYGIYAVAGTVNVTSGNITQNTYGTFNYGGTINIAGGNITNNSYGVYNSTGTTNITAGTINTNNYGVYNNTGITNISQITLTGNTKEVYNGGTGTINIISGNITTSGETAVENASSGIIVVGTQDGNVITDSPVIQSEEYGITNSGNGTIKFYDGTIKGKNGALFGLYLYLENGYKVKTDYTDDYYCDTLTPSGTVSTVASIGGIEYTNLQSAINACTQEEASTITLVNSINTNTTFVVEEGQNIIIDLNGKNIISSEAESTIDNAGTLTIIDTHDSQTGKISNSYAVAINNTGTLTLGQDDGTVSTTCPEVVGTTYGIVNNGIFNFYDGIIKAGRAIDGSITSRANGYVINKTTTDGIEKLVLAR